MMFNKKLYKINRTVIRKQNKKFAELNRLYRRINNEFICFQCDFKTDNSITFHKHYKKSRHRFSTYKFNE